MKAAGFAAFCSILMLSGCTSDNGSDIGDPFVKEDAPVRFSVQMDDISVDGESAGKSTRAGGDIKSEDAYLNLRFKEKDRIRIVNTLITNQTPDFTTQGKFYEYVYDSESGRDGSYVKCAFVPYGGNGFYWSDLNLTGAYYVLEAAFYPIGYDPSYFDGDKVPEDQSDADVLLRSDLLLAHHLHHVTEWGNEIHLKFHHVFSLIYTTFTVPSYDVVTNTGFPAPETDADFPKGCLTNFRTGYNINYHANIASDAVISVRANPDADMVDEIEMCPSGYMKDTIANTVTYYYLAIIPTQVIDYSGTVPMHRFYLKDNAGNVKRYRFVPRTTPIAMEQGKMTQIDLVLPRDGVEPILINARIAPWTHAYSNMILEEQK